MARATPREKLLGAVVDAAMAGGIAGRSLREIADAAGTSHRMLIHHFGSREGLLVEVVRAVEERQRAVLGDLRAGTGDLAAELPDRFWKHLRSPALAPQERLFFELYGQALQGHPWAGRLLDGIVDNWVGPVAAMLETGGVAPEKARAVARLSVAVSRGLLLDVLATGDDEEVDTAMRCFSDMLVAYLSGPAGSAGAPASDQGQS
jgi:AcrR family transcriptional regulator